MNTYKTNNLICVKEAETKFNRLDRNTFRMTYELQKAIHEGVFTDYHCYRPK